MAHFDTQTFHVWLNPPLINFVPCRIYSSNSEAFSNGMKLHTLFHSRINNSPPSATVKCGRFFGIRSHFQMLSEPARCSRSVVLQPRSLINSPYFSFFSTRKGSAFFRRARGRNAGDCLENTTRWTKGVPRFSRGTSISFSFLPRRPSGSKLDLVLDTRCRNYYLMEANVREWRLECDACHFE